MIQTAPTTAPPAQEPTMAESPHRSGDDPDMTESGRAEPTEPSVTPPEREGVRERLPTVEQASSLAVAWSITATQPGAFSEADADEAWDVFQNALSRLAAPAPATGELVAQVMSAIVGYGDLREGHEPNAGSVLPSIRDLIESALARPAELVVPEITNEEVEAATMAVLDAATQEGPSVTMGTLALAALVAARSARDGRAS